MAILKRTPKSSDTASPSAGPVKRGTLGNKPKIVIPISVVAEVSDNTNYRVVVERYMQKVKNPKTAIRAKCVECSGGSLKEVQNCRVVKCALHPFRMGANPFHLKTIKRLSAENGGAEENEDEG